MSELDPSRLADQADVVFLALPHMESQRAVPILRGQGRKVIDLSADYRLRDAALYGTWYKADHIDAVGLAEAVYGLPELHRKAIATASLVANPGCYPMGAVLATAPLIKSGLGRGEGIVVDGKSGVTGAGAQGRKVEPMYLYTEANENVHAYGIGTHRHTPEIEQELAALGADVRVTFTAHLLPLDQGELVSCYVTSSNGELRDARALYEDFYAGEPFVELSDTPPGVRDVRETNLCRIHATVEPATGRVLVFSATDNLWKGAAGQAVQDLNLMLGLDETDGLA